MDRISMWVLTTKTGFKFGERIFKIREVLPVAGSKWEETAWETLPIARFIRELPYQN